MSFKLLIRQLVENPLMTQYLQPERALNTTVAESTWLEEQFAVTLEQSQWSN